jgi:DNA-binding transcriptional MocR family regulator
MSIIVIGAVMGIISLFFKSLPRESNIVVEESSYDRVLMDAKCYGHHLVGVKLTSEGVDLNQLRNVVKKNSIAAFYGIPFHQNPTGINYNKRGTTLKFKNSVFRL